MAARRAGLLTWLAGALALTPCAAGCAGADDASEPQSDEPRASAEQAFLPTPNYQEALLAQGSDWKLMALSGFASDDNSAYYDEDVYVLKGINGVSASPLPAHIKTNLDIGNTADAVAAVNKFIVDQIVVSEQLGALTPALQAIAEPADVLLPEAHKSNAKLFGKCLTQHPVKSKVVNLSTPISKTYNLGNGFNGTLALDGATQGSLTIDVTQEKKRYALFGVCIPYATRFESAHVYGNIQVQSGSSISGTASYSNSWSWELLKTSLGSIDFLVGTVPVHIDLKLVIDAGVDLAANAGGSVQYNGSQAATGNINVTCTLSSCSGSASYNVAPSLPSSISGEIHGKIEPSVWVQAGVRASLYNEWLANIQAGVRPYLRGDLWGYYGASCGDADGNGSNELVDALTFDLDWQIYLTGQASAFGGDPVKWNDLWHTNRMHIGFWDLIGSDAMQPMLGGPSPANKGMSTPYSARMRPCWPYNDSMSYQLLWGDGALSTLSGSPTAWTASSHAWANTGSYPLLLTAQSDNHGRALGGSTSRTIDVIAGAGGALIPPMSGNTAPAGAVTRSGVLAGNYEGWQAFDASVGTLWLSNMNTSSVWIGYEWGGGAKKTVTSYEIAYNNGSCCEQRGPKSWLLKGWNGSSWVTVDTVTNQTGWYANPVRSYTVDSPGQYSSYRLYVTADNYNNATYPITLVSIASIQLFGS